MGGGQQGWTLWGLGGHREGDGLYLKNNRWTSLAVQWLRLPTSTAGDTGSIPGQGTKIPLLRGQKKTKPNKTKTTGHAGRVWGGGAAHRT